MGKTRFDELELTRQPKIASANVVTTASATYTQAEITAICTLLNEIKTKLNTILKG